jgi:hypothetical protein
MDNDSAMKMAEASELVELDDEEKRSYQHREEDKEQPEYLVSCIPHSVSIIVIGTKFTHYTHQGVIWRNLSLSGCIFTHLQLVDQRSSAKQHWSYSTVF